MNSRITKIPKSSKIPKRAFLAICALIFILGVANIVFSCHLATAGEKMKDFDAEIQRLEKDNERLEKKVVALSSYATISQQARTLGFEKSFSVIYIKGRSPLAMR